MFMALETPWKSEAVVVTAVESADAGVAEENAGARKGKRRRRRGKASANNPDGLQAIDERVQLSAADRKMVWRGPAVAKSKQAVDFQSAGESRSLTQGEINGGIGPGQNKLGRCIADARGQAELAAKITLKFLVAGQGRATKVRVRAPSYLLKHGLYECASRAVKSMRFPATGGETVVTLPFDLSF